MILSYFETFFKSSLKTYGIHCVYYTLLQQSCIIFLNIVQSTLFPNFNFAMLLINLPIKS